MLCLSGMSVKIVNIPWQIYVLVFLYAYSRIEIPGLPLVCTNNQWRTVTIDPNVAVFL